MELNAPSENQDAWNEGGAERVAARARVHAATVALVEAAAAGEDDGAARREAQEAGIVAMTAGVPIAELAETDTAARAQALTRVGDELLKSIAAHSAKIAHHETERAALIRCAQAAGVSRRQLAQRSGLGSRAVQRVADVA